MTFSVQKVLWKGCGIGISLAAIMLLTTMFVGSATSSREAHPNCPPESDTCPFYGLQYVPRTDLKQVSDLGIEVVLQDFPYDGTPNEWNAYLDAAHAQDLKVVAWLWPPGFTWDGDAWQIDAQTTRFIQTVASHPALFAVYTLHEPYWNECEGCGYTTAQQQQLYRAVKKIADVPVWSAVDSMAFWTEQGPATAFADGICDYCETWYYPFRSDGSYERDTFIARLKADLQVARERAPNAKFVWTMQSFAQDKPYNLRMPTADEMQDMATIVYAQGVDGAMWYTWTFNDLYSDFLVNHPELHGAMRETYDQTILCERIDTFHTYLPLFAHIPIEIAAYRR